MLRLHNDILNAIEKSNKQTDGIVIVLKGRDCFVKYYNTLKNLYKYEATQESASISEMERIEDAYQTFWTRSNDKLSHYFRFLYRTIRFVEESNTKDKQLYASIIISQLSDQELILLYYNCLSSNGIKKFKPLAEKYALFDNLPVDILFEESHMYLYESSAWGDNPGYHKKDDGIMHENERVQL
jgi:hypothetical protein